MIKMDGGEAGALIDRFYARLEHAVVKEDGELLATLLKLDLGMAENNKKAIQLYALLDQNTFKASSQAAQRRYSASSEFHELSVLHLLGFRELCVKIWNKAEVGYSLAVKYQIKKFDKFLELYKQRGAWLAPAMAVLILDMRMLAKRADLEVGDDDNGYLVEAKRLLDSCFRYTIMGRASTADGVSKRMSALMIITNQLKIYFKLGTLQLCKNLIRSVGQPNFPPFESFPVSHRVTYKFYVGRIKVLEDDMQGANENLSYALEHCNKRQARNVLLILEYLIPVKLILGFLPQPRLLTVSGLKHLHGLVLAVKKGNVKDLTSELEQNQTYFIERGLYLILDRLKLIAYRNLFRRVVLIHQENVRADPQQKSSAAQRVPLHQLYGPFKRFGETIEEDLGEEADSREESGLEQIKCIVANLIYKGYIKGYISHEKNFLVLSANQPFPPLAKQS